MEAGHEPDMRKSAGAGLVLPAGFSGCGGARGSGPGGLAVLLQQQSDCRNSLDEGRIRHVGDGRHELAVQRAKHGGGPVLHERFGSQMEAAARKHGLFVDWINLAAAKDASQPIYVGKSGGIGC